MTPRLRAVGPGVLAALAAALTIGTLTTPAEGAPPTTQTSPATLARAATIQSDVNRRIRLASDAPLAVTDVAPTDVVDSFTLLSEDLIDARFVPAVGGVWYTLCTEHASCPYPAPSLSRPASDPLTRRLALELALRTFLETDAPVVGISLPTPNFVAVIFERDELAGDVDMVALAARLSREAPVDRSASALTGVLRGEGRLEPAAALQLKVDALTRPRTYLFVDFEPGPYGPRSWAGIPCWPVLSW